MGERVLLVRGLIRERERERERGLYWREGFIGERDLLEGFIGESFIRGFHWREGFIRERVLLEGFIGERALLGFIRERGLLETGLICEEPQLWCVR